MGWNIVYAGEPEVGGPPPPVEESDWDPGEPTFEVEDGQTTYIWSTGPAGYTTGGVYLLDSGILPAGIVFNEDGTLVNTDAAASEIDAVFAYYEPGSLPTMTMTPNKTGTYPYWFGVYLNEGVCPAGRYLVSPDDTNLRGKPINTWPDGSARTCVVYSTARAMVALTTQTIRIRISNALDSDATALTTTYINSLLTDIVFSFGFAAGPQTITDFTSGSTHYRKTWWANSQAICASYIIDLGPGSNVMQAVVDVHAFADGYCFVECVVENCKVNAGGTNLTNLSTTTYTNATIAVNGGTVATVSSPKPSYQTAGQTLYSENGHGALRKFYVGAWVTPAGVASAIRGTSDPWVEIVHDNLYMQSLAILTGKHSRTYSRDPETNVGTNSSDPSYARPSMVATSPSGNLTQPNGSDFYRPWDMGRHKPAHMGGPGQISIIQLPEHRYVQGGAKLRMTARAALASTLGVMSYCVHTRDISGEIPTVAQLGTKYRNETSGHARFWYGYGTDIRDPNYELDHQPGIGLVTFIIQPSPWIIEMLQGIAIWNATHDANTPCALTFVQCRGRAWIMRNVNHVRALTPDGHAWQAIAEDLIYRNMKRADNFRATGNFELNVFYQYEPNKNTDGSVNTPGYSVDFWNYVWQQAEMYRAWQAKLLNEPGRRAELKVLLDWMLQLPIRYVNEQAHTGAWRYHGLSQSVGRNGLPENASGNYFGDTYYAIDPDCYADWDECAQAQYLDYPPPTVSGQWMTDGGSGYSTSTGRRYANYAGGTSAGSLNTGYNYDSYFMPMVAWAAEMDYPGAAEMWTTVHDGITNMSTWLNGYRLWVQNDCWPRNKVLDK